MPSGFKITEDTLTAGIQGLEPFLDEVVGTTMDYYAPQTANYAKTNAPWTDRTGNARNGLIAKSEKTGISYAIILAHQMPYGIWLEVANGQRYAIIMPTIQVMGPRVMKTLNNVLARYKS